MALDTENKLRLRFWISLAVVCLIGVIASLWLTGVLRPPRPLFHSKYVTPFNSDRLPHWVAVSHVVDQAGNLCFFDLPKNIVLLDLAAERSEENTHRNPKQRAPQGEQWLNVPYFGWVLVPADPQDLLIITGDHTVITLAPLQQGNAAVVQAWWDESRPDTVQALIDDDRIPLSIRTALDELLK